VLEIRQHQGADLAAQLPRLESYALRGDRVPLSRHPAWLTVLGQGLGQVPYCLEAVAGGQTRGLLPLVHLRSVLFGKFLVSLPYLNTAGIVAEDGATAATLIEHAAGLADELGVRYLELRHERPVRHPSLRGRMTSKVHLRLPLPDTAERLWAQIPGKVRNQVRKGRKGGFTVLWGGRELLPDFYEVFSHTMRDLGTPVYGRGLFYSILRQFPARAEFCVVRAGALPVAAALLLHGRGVTELPSACSLHEYHPTCANMLMYLHLLERAVQRGQQVFDFGRCTRGSGTHAFKKQWGAREEPAEWQYYVREGTAADMRPENPQYQRLIRIWQSLPVSLTRLIGPPIVRGIP
jgi:FemAB-related protein (PEP-CTERM system-associated)